MMVISGGAGDAVLEPKESDIILAPALSHKLAWRTDVDAQAHTSIYVLLFPGVVHELKE